MTEGPGMNGTGAAELKVLLVEDNPADARLVREMLKDAHHPLEVRHPARVRDGLEFLRTRGFNAILLDHEHGSMWGGSSDFGEDYGIGW